MRDSPTIPLEGDGGVHSFTAAGAGKAKFQTSGDTDCCPAMPRKLRTPELTHHFGRIIARADDRLARWRRQRRLADTGARLADFVDSQKPVR